jgi:hypothetical protein
MQRGGEVFPLLSPPKANPMSPCTLGLKLQSLTEACAEATWSDSATDGASKNFRKRFY